MNISSEFNHGSVSWGSPWSQHALLCLFMDIIENDKINSEAIDGKADDVLSQKNQPNKTFKFEAGDSSNLKIIEETEELSTNENKSSTDLFQHLSDDQKCSISAKILSDLNAEIINESKGDTNEKSTNKTDDLKETTSKNFFMNVQSLHNHLTNFSLFDMNNQKAHTLKKASLSNYYPLIKNKCIPAELHSLAISYDNRLDNSIFQTIENNLFINICIQNDAINKSVSEPLPSIFPSLTTNFHSFNFNDQLNMLIEPQSTDSSSTESAEKTKPFKSKQTSSISLIQDTLEFIFRDLTTVNLENLLSFWLTLAMLDSEIKYDSNQESLFYLNTKTASYLLDFLLKYSYMNVKLWHLSFRMLSVVISTSHKSSGSIISSFVNSDSLYKFIYKFISSNEELVGDECCNSMSEFLVRFSELIMNQELEKHFKKKLFEILCDCIDENGCVSRHQGPLDAQVVFIEYLISEDILICFDLETMKENKILAEEYNIQKKNEEFERMFMRYFDSLSKLAHYHICVYPRLSIKGVTSPRSCFSGVLTSLLFGSRTLKASSKSNDKTKAELNDFSFNQQNSFGFVNLTKINLNNNNNNSSTNNANSNTGNNKNQYSNKYFPQSYTNNKYSILCNRDNLICLLLKMAINLISNLKSECKSYSKVQKQVDLLEKVIFEEQNAEHSSIQQENFNKDDSLISQNNEFYDDDLLLQQLFLYELQQIDENESNTEPNPQENISEADFSYENEPHVNNIEEEFDSNDSQKKDENLMNLINNSTIKSDKLIQLISNESLELFIESLGLCQSSALAMVISNSSYPIELNLEDIQTPGDGLFLLLKYISSMPVKLVTPSYNYLNKIKRLSEPLLWFFSALFSNEDAVNYFINLGGVEVISKGFALTTRQLLYSGPCIVSSLMNLIDSDRQNIKLINNYDNESTEGFTNFASFGSIMCTNPSGNPVDVLLQNTATHRRIRSAIWSYHFQQNEHKVGLFLTFPHTFLLKEVHVLPHTVSFGNCPAYVSLEEMAAS